MKNIVVLINDDIFLSNRGTDLLLISGKDKRDWRYKCVRRKRK